jgi:hypothetical protein
MNYLDNIIQATVPAHTTIEQQVAQAYNSITNIGGVKVS